ncbi:aminoglycoside 6-adenylyltransferase [Bacillus sp. 1P06AnD]|uniref:aminoglycoside 6-adenylyltransferase n=1 Tax=Bacillus sp. 1P06AnD TaxID=3132208 RepID=UPI0039A0F2E2
MRTKQEMMDLIVRVAEKDERIRAVGMNGSRVNRKAPRDIFQDYDIVYLVSELDSFLQNPEWIDVFGERIILQTPEDMSLFPPELGGRFTYLMLFKDGNRIDLMLAPVEEKGAYCKEDSLTKIVLDKDGDMPTLSNPTDQDYWIAKPSEAHFADCCNEFWWVSTYVVKGLWRKEILYAQDHLNGSCRQMLLKMLDWQVGIETGFAVSTGKNSKYLKQYITDKEWEQLMATYAGGNYEAVWNSLFSSVSLFRKTAIRVADSLGFDYNSEEDQNVSAYLERVRQLPPDADVIYE